MMPPTEQFVADDMTVTVEETHDELRYTFTRDQPTVRALPFVFDLIFAVIPLALAAIAGYVVIMHGAGRPEWEIALSWLFIVQMATLAALTPGVATRISSQFGWRRKIMEIVFTREAYIHRTGSEFDGPVCDIREVRGFRVFNALNDTRPAELPKSIQLPERLGFISVAVGEERRTQGMFAGPTPESMAMLAHHMHGRLTAFRRAIGLESTLDPVEVIETTSEIATSESHTLPPRPPHGFVQQLMWKGLWALLSHRGLCLIWCVGVFAGLIGVISLLIAAKLNAVVSLYILAAIFHAALLGNVWKAKTTPAVGQPTQDGS